MKLSPYEKTQYEKIINRVNTKLRTITVNKTLEVYRESCRSGSSCEVVFKNFPGSRPPGGCVDFLVGDLAVKLLLVKIIDHFLDYLLLLQFLA